MKREVLGRVEGVLAGPQDVDGSGDRSELLSKRPVSVVGEGSVYHLDRCAEQRRSLPFGIFATPVRMLGQKHIDRRWIGYVRDDRGMDLLRRDLVEGDSRIDEQVGSGESLVHGSGPNGHGTAERMADNETPWSRARFEYIPGVGIEAVAVRMGAITMPTKVGRNGRVSRCLERAGDLPPHWTGRTESVKEQHIRDSVPESMDVQLHWGRHCTPRWTGQTSTLRP